MAFPKEQKAWKRVGHGQRFLNAFRGMYVFWMTTHSLFRIGSTMATLGVIFFGFYFRISNFEWIAIAFAVGLVFISEAFNTAIEIDIDLTSPGYHPFARDTKDVAAAAVVFSVFIATIVGLIIFLPLFIAKFF